ncbi:hemerythrin domain-containing protein [Halomonas saccharevitans]|uniref:Hemerythrin domain-containing protein n=1 Tax=Halomonas saccharevitans TaxID=416872 RepID=A0A1I6YV65_9GAMM|nr:hemerythrin domain-containing protein [Halomonas saccharevitans]MDT8878660.1 hemerythrin domain-containing protein [Halomonas saccharevitans]SFT54307.1 Hemerythrin-like domain-containing protein [Halomonas saccharevitans]
MPKLNQLRQDHANMARMLHVLQLKQKTLAQGARPNFQLVREVVDYILDYQEGFTRPLEKVCSERLKELDPSSAEVTEQLAKDYRSLKARLNRLSNDLDMILMDSVVPMDKFAEDLKSYLESHRAYLREEREQLFPLIRENFNDEDFKALAEALPEGAQDHVARLEEAYPELYHELRDAPVPQT